MSQPRPALPVGLSLHAIIAHARSHFGHADTKLRQNATQLQRRRTSFSRQRATIWSNHAMLDRNIRDPAYWRTRAKEARAEADQTLDQSTKRALLAIAVNYDELAARAEAMINSRKPPT